MKNTVCPIMQNKCLIDKCAWYEQTEERCAVLDIAYNTYGGIKRKWQH